MKSNLQLRLENLIRLAETRTDMRISFGPAFRPGVVIVIETATHHCSDLLPFDMLEQASADPVPFAIASLEDKLKRATEPDKPAGPPDPCRCNPLGMPDFWNVRCVHSKACKEARSTRIEAQIREEAEKTIDPRLRGL